MLYTEQYRTECAAKNPGDQSRISPGPVSNGLTQCRPPAEAPPATPAAAYASHASSSLQQKHSSRRKFPPVERMCVRSRRQGPTTEAATTETSHLSRSSSSSSQQAHERLWICWEIPLTMWTEAVAISASRYCDTMIRQQRSRR